tara:strand:+ start:2367 stop:2567 length:201 start_codon:yes stop_codon:yes gene_type:complete
MKNTAKNTDCHVLRNTDSDGQLETADFQGCENGVNVTFSYFGEGTVYSVDKAREIYRDLIARGWGV